jgi:hypothetical protein
MARKRVVSRKELRDEAEAAEKAGTTKKKKARAKSPTKRSSRKAPVDVRMKLFWGVYNQSLKRVALYEFDQKEAADQKAEELSKSGKSPHFVQRVKEPVVEE